VYDNRYLDARVARTFFNQERKGVPRDAPFFPGWSNEFYGFWLFT
jgi:hypothetical protein